MKFTRTMLGLVLAVVLSGHGGWAASSPPTQTPTTTYQWRNVTIIAGGFVDGLVFSPVQDGLVFARTDIGGAYRWDKSNQRWIPLNDWAGGRDGNLLGCESIGVDPTDAKRFYLALGTYTSPSSPNGAIVGTADGGRTWRRADVPFKMGGNEEGRSAGERLAVDPNDNRVLFFGSRNDGLWRSADYGATWSQVSGFPVQGRTNGVGVVFALFEKSSGSARKPTPILYAGVSQNNGPSLYRSADSGSTWQSVPGQPLGLLPHHGILGRDGVLYLTYGDRPGPNGMSDGTVWRFDTAHGVWTNITPLESNGHAGFGYAGLAVDARNPSTLMVSTMDRWNPGDTLFRSRDGGQTWTDLGPQATRDWSLTPYVTFGSPSARLGWWIGALAIDPFRPGHALYGTGATIWASDNVTNADASQPTHWTVGAQGIEETAVLDLISPPVGAHLLSGLGDIGGFRHDDFIISPVGGLWKPTVTSTTSLDFAENAPAVIARVGNGGPGAYSTDGGTSWTAFAAAPSNGVMGGTISVSADGATFVWAPSGSAPCFSRDRGATWTPCAGVPGGRRFVPVADRAAPNTFYLTVGRQLLVSKDGGATFTVRTVLPAGAMYLRAAPGRRGDLWLTAGRSGLYHSTDGGATFVSIGSVPDAERLGFGKAAPGHDYPALYLTGQTPRGASGIFRSDDTGQTWVQINDDQHQYGFSGGIVTGDPRIYGRVYWGTNGRGILYGDPALK